MPKKKSEKSGCAKFMGAANARGQQTHAKMTSTFEWLMLIIHGSELPIKQRRVVNCSWEDSFGCILKKFGQPEATISKIEISDREKFADPVHAVPPDAPILLCEQFKCFYVCILLKRKDLDL